MNKPVLVTRHLDQVVVRWLRQAQSVYLLLAFIKQSGVEELLPALADVLQQQAEIKVLTGDYLLITEPEALDALLSLGPGIEIRMWQTAGEAFHPKAYVFQSDDWTHVVVGSSNLSRSALTTGVEWNLAIENVKFHAQDPVTEFMTLFYAEQTIPVNPVTVAEYRRRRAQYQAAWPNITSMWTESTPAPTLDTIELEDWGEDAVSLRTAQREALSALSDAVNEGHRRGMVVLPTGLGKTYVAAFFARMFQRVLFVAHREEILRQAALMFRQVIPDRSQAFFTGSEKGEADIVFASVFALAAVRNRRRFKPEQFDLLVVDEFHHAAAPSYEALLSYFAPRFVLGLTATPERLDNKDVYALCDGNVVYQLTLAEAINRAWLAPFHYYGVHDPIDYRTIPWRGTHYDDDALAHAQIDAAYAAWVFRGFEQYRQKRTLAFCAGVRQAVYFAQYFASRGVSARALTATISAAERRTTLEAFQAGEIAVIFSVDLFNEGLDAPATDTILLIRPTDSSVIFLQQIGRGLRTFADKSHCTIIDFVGNYRNADHKLRLLGVSNLAAALRGPAPITTGLPAGCFIELDLAAIDVLKKLANRHTPRKILLQQALWAVKEELGRRPTYVEFHLKSGVESRIVRQEFGSFVGLLEQVGDLSLQETRAFREAQGWLETVERTAMSQSYKMVLLRIMLARGNPDWRKPIAAKEVAEPFYRYLHENTRWLKERQPQALFRATFDEARVVRLIVQNPMHYLATTHPAYFSLTNEMLMINPGVLDENASALVREWTEEVVDYRLYVYFRE